MKTTHIPELLRAAIAARSPLLLIGAPGVGKSDLVAQAAQAAEAALIVSHPVTADPTDAKGLPWPDRDGEQARFLPFGDLAAAIGATGPTVWLLDDLGQASPAVQAAYMQLLLARRVNGHALPDCVTLLAASNRRTDRAGVTGMLEPVKSRFASIIEVEADVDGWSEWALDAGLPAALVAFIRYRPDLLSAFRPTGDMTQSPSPRTWANVAKIEAWGLPKAIEAEAMAGAVGAGASTEYLAFRSMAAALVSADQILLDPQAAALPGKPAECYATCTALASRASAKNFDRVATYAARLHDGAKGEFAALLCRDSLRRDTKIGSCAAFIRAMAGPLGQLISGGDEK